MELRISKIFENNNIDISNLMDPQMNSQLQNRKFSISKIENENVDKSLIKIENDNNDNKDKDNNDDLNDISYNNVFSNSKNILNSKKNIRFNTNLIDDNDNENDIEVHEGGNKNKN
jgi:hypothetical protein